MRIKHLSLVIILLLALSLAGAGMRSQAAAARTPAEAAFAPPPPPPDVQPSAAARRFPQGGPAAGFSDAPDAQRPTTPALIEAAYQRGEIRADQRLLYLAYAVYEYGSLPAEYRSRTPWSGTQVVAEIRAAAAKMEAAPGLLLPETTQTELQRLLSPQTATVCSEEDQASSVNSTNFRVNYGTITGLSITDYTTALETTFATEVTSYGWAKPPLCTGATCTDNPWDRYPVQVAPLGGGLYGYVTVGGIYTGLIGNNPNTAAAETDAYASCMVLNSNYSTFPGGALASLQVTAAHEFNHSIQFGYGDPSPFEDDIWYESIAAYIEDDVYDSLNDNYQFLYPNFTSCTGQFTGNVYSDWLFFRYAAERTGGTNLAGGGEDVAQGFWANVSLGQTGLGAYNNALLAKGANLNDIYHSYAIASRFMKTCPTGSPYCYEEAAGYVASKGTPGNQGSIASVPGSYSGSVEDNYALNWIGLPASGTYSVTLTNNSASSGVLRASVVASTPSGLAVTAIPGLASASGSIQLANYTVPAGATSVVAVITNQQKTADNPSSCTLAPYTLSLTQGGSSGGGDFMVYLPMIAKNAFVFTGRVTQDGLPLAGAELKLRYFDGTTWSTYVTTTTASDGYYTLIAPPPDGSKKYYVRWDNPSSNPAQLYLWACNQVSASGGNMTCSFDVKDVPLAAPADGTVSNLPRTFSWTPRGIGGDNYQWRIYNYSINSSEDVPFYESPMLGAASSYALTFLPTGFVHNGSYGWDVLVQGANGYGISYAIYDLTFAVNVTPSGGSAVVNGGFESGSNVGWQEYSSNGWPLTYNSGFPAGIGPHSGSWAAWLGGDSDETSRLYQAVTIPATNPMLGFWYWVDSAETCGYDYFWVVITTGGQNYPISEYELCSSTDTGGWRQAYVSLRSYAGQSVTVQLWAYSYGGWSNFFVDDVWLGTATLSAAAAPQAETPQAPSVAPVFTPKTR
jgi:hypothetical protein